MEPDADWLDERAEAARLELLAKLAAYRRVWGFLFPRRKSLAREALLRADRAVSAWVGQGRITPGCRDRLLRTLKYVEYWYLGVGYWGPQDSP